MSHPSGRAYTDHEVAIQTTHQLLAEIRDTLNVIRDALVPNTEPDAEEPAKLELEPGSPEPQVPGIRVRNEHFDAVVFADREYRVKTMVPGVERKPRYSRMHFMGLQYPNSPRTSALTFSARGPDRTHSGRYGGTQNVSMNSILEMTEVERDVPRRYAFLRERPVDDRYDGQGAKP